MTTTTSPQSPVDRSEDAPAAPEDRGKLTIGERVVERIAGYAVTQVPHAVAAPRRILGMSMGQARPEDDAYVEASVHGSVVSLEVSLAVEWPHPVDGVARAARTQVRHDVERMTGMRVDHVDVEVTSLDVPAGPTRRVR